ncbi:MAG: hypothetical protein GC149_18935 [Gammaproteobacteria bacterium]|nr:hypothetical protein [Gammaproteobacteria bacterium]
MTEQNDKDLNGKSSLSDLYQQLTADEPGKQVDAAILQAARRAVQPEPRRRHWTLPAAIAAILIIGVSLIWWQHANTPMVVNTTDSAAPAAEPNLPQAIDRRLHDNPAADAWLTRILALHQAGKTAQAAAQFKKFRETYPVYNLDQQRFGELQQYDK